MEPGLLSVSLWLSEWPVSLLEVNEAGFRGGSYLDNGITVRREEVHDRMPPSDQEFALVMGHDIVHVHDVGERDDFHIATGEGR
jgi:hypothetical protein